MLLLLFSLFCSFYSSLPLPLFFYCSSFTAPPILLFKIDVWKENTHFLKIP